MLTSTLSSRSPKSDGRAYWRTETRNHRSPTYLAPGGLDFENEEPLIEHQQVTSDTLTFLKFSGQQ